MSIRKKQKIGSLTELGKEPVQPEPKWTPSGQMIANAYAATQKIGTPVYMRLKNCIADLIDDGSLSTEAQLPPEQWLARELGISLGTIQKSLGALNAEGYIQRRQGHGTYVAAPPQPMTELWHYRFFDPETDTFAPIYSHLIDRKIITDQGIVRILGDDPEGFIEIQRSIIVAGEFKCHSRLFLGASHFAPLLQADPSIFDNVNLKNIFSTQFARPTVRVSQRVHLVAPDPEANKVLRLAKGTLALKLCILASSHQGPYSYQEATIPQSRFLLDMSFLGEGQGVPPR